MLTLGEAAKEVGKSKTTLTRAINSGRMSANRQDDGSYQIDPAELLRVYPDAAPRDPIETPSRSVDSETVTRLQSEINELKQRLETSEDDRRQAEDDRRREIERVTLLLTHEQDSRSKEGERFNSERDKLTSMAQELGQLQSKAEEAEKSRVAAEAALREMRAKQQPKRWSLFG